jgi:WD40 repeat protein
MIWDIASGNPLSAIPHGQNTVKSAVFNHDGNLIAGGLSNGSVNIYEASSGTLVQTLANVAGEVEGLSFSPDGSSLVIGANNLTVWNLSTQSASAVLEGYTRAINTIQYNHDASLLAAGTREGTVLVWEPATDRLVYSFSRHTDEVTSLSFSFDGRYLAAGSLDNTTIMWDLSTGEPVNEFRGHSNGVKSIQFSPDTTRIVTAGGWVDLSVRFWDIVSGENTNNLVAFTKGDIKLAAQPEVNLLASGGGDRVIRVWNFETRELVATLEGHSRLISSIAFSPDGSLLATAEEGVIYIWVARTWALLGSLQTQSVNNIAFSRDNRLLIAAGETIEFWDIDSRSLVYSISGTAGEMYAISMRPDGGVLSAANSDGSLILFGVP